MGAGSSSELPAAGFHVLQVCLNSLSIDLYHQVQPGSPGDRANLAAFFDFIVAAQGVPMV
jgi:hypothetical protein